MVISHTQERTAQGCFDGGLPILALADTASPDWPPAGKVMGGLSDEVQTRPCPGCDFRTHDRRKQNRSGTEMPDRPRAGRGRRRQAPPPQTPAETTVARVSTADSQRHRAREEQKGMKREKRRKSRHQRERRRLEWASGGSAH